MINQITQKITELSTFPDRLNYGSSAAYAKDVSTWLEEQKDIYPELNTLIDQLNSFISEENAAIDDFNAAIVDQLNSFISEKNAAIDEINTTRDEIDVVGDIVKSNVNYRGDWVSGTAYQTGESVTYSDGNDYLSKIDNNTDEPPNHNWKLVPKVVSYDDIGATVEPYDATILKEADIGVKVSAQNTKYFDLENKFKGL